MWQKLKKIGCYLIIIILLPYVVTVFINGPSIRTSPYVDDIYIKVQSGDGEVEMPLEEYGIGVLAKEMPADYEEEALKAQAVLVRTDMYKQVQEEEGAVVFSEEFWDRKKMEEAWGVKDGRNYRKLSKAWQDTEGQILTWQDQPAYAPFFRLSNGCTRSGKEVLGNEDCPYLQILECPYDLESEEQLQTVVTEDMDAEVTDTDTAGYVLNVRVGKENISGEEFRKRYDLASACFTLQRYNGKMRITTRGEGHGLGMSQYTANEMAKEGEKWEDILEYFFEDCDQKEVAEILLKSE